MTSGLRETPVFTPRAWSLVPILIVAACIAFAATRLDWRLVLEMIRRADMRALSLALLCFAAAQASFGLRMHALLPPETRPSRRACVAYLLIGGLLNSLLPMRMGDVMRGVLVARAHGVPLGYAAGEVVIERVADAMMVGVAGVMLLALYALPERASTGILAFGAIAVGVVLVGVIAAQKPVMSRLAHFIGAGSFGRRIRAKLGAMLVDALAAGRQALSSSAGVQALMPHIAGWIAAGLALVFSMGAVHIAAPQPAATLAVLVLTSIGGLIVAAPLGFGPWHALAVASLAMFGVAHEQAVAFALLAHGLGTGLLIVGGIASMFCLRATAEITGLVRSGAAAPTR